jgi:periplasmic protein TonB
MKKLLLVLCCSMAGIGCLQAQEYHFATITEIVEMPNAQPPVVRQSCPPSFLGGHQSLEKFIKQHARYPERALREGITGTIYVKVRVLETGQLTILGVDGYLGGGCEQEALRLVSLMPPWNPALRHSVPVSCRVRIPIIFQ